MLPRMTRWQGMWYLWSASPPLVVRCNWREQLGQACKDGSIAIVKSSADVIIAGAGHNGLVAALLLARQGLEVLVLEDKEGIGGACRTEYPFKTAPHLGTST